MFRSLGVCLYTSSRRLMWTMALAAVIGCLIPQAASAEYAEQQQQQPTNRNLTTNVGNVQIGLYGELIVNLSGADNGTAGGDVPLWAAPGSGIVTFPDGSTGRV